MSGYNEMIGNYELMREMVRQYFVFGVDSRSDYSEKQNRKPRAQGNDIQRLQSWLGAYLDYYTDDKGRRIHYFTVSGRSVLQNPLYLTYLSKTAKSRQTQLFFYALAVLSDGKFRKPDEIRADMLTLFSDAVSRLGDKRSDSLCEMFDSFDDSTLRNALEAYTALGVFEVRQKGRTSLYRLNPTDISLAPLRDALYFASEQDPVGVLGYYLLNRIGDVPSDIRFKHHYFLNALNDGVLYTLFDAMQRGVWISVMSDTKQECPIIVYPLKLYLSVQNGRQHLLCYDRDRMGPGFLRIDRIRDIAPVKLPDLCPLTEEALAEFESHLWGPGYRPKDGEALKHVELRIHVAENETYIIRRLEREKRCASLEQISDTQWLIRADVYHVLDLFPWIYSLIGRIEDFSCSDPSYPERFAETLHKMIRLYEADEQPAPSAESNIAPASLRLSKKRPLPIFHEMYGAYYGATAAFLRELHGKSCRNASRALGRLLTDSFADANVNLLHLMKGDWMLLFEDPADQTLFSPIQQLPPFPLTTPELRWMKTVFADPRVSLFLPEEGVPALDGVKPLYSPDKIVYYDRYTDGDPFTDPNYRARFRTVLDAIRNHRKLGIRFLSTNSGKEQYEEVRPLRLEYSEKDDKFRLIAERRSRLPMQINLATVLHCETHDAFLPEDSIEEEEQQIVLDLFDDHNALERVLLHFSDLKKKTERTGEHTYRVTLNCRESEKREMVMRILSFNTHVRVQSPVSVKNGVAGSVREEIRKRLQKQAALLHGALHAQKPPRDD